MTPQSLLHSPWLRRAAWALGVLLGVWVLAWLAVPPLLKSQIEAKGSEALGRKLTIGAIDFKPWTLELTVSDIAVATADGKAQQFGVARIYVDAELESLLRLAPVLDAITVDAPTAQITHKGDGSYDMDDIVARLTAPSDQPPSAAARFALYNVTLNGGEVDFIDHPQGQATQHTLRKLHLALPFLSNLESKRDVKVAPRLAFDLNGSTFDTAAQGTPFAQVRKGDGTLKIVQFDLAPYLAYLPASLPVKLKSAVVDAQLGLQFEQTQQARVSLSGSVTLSQLKVADGAGAELLAVESIHTVLADVRPLEQVVKLESVEVVAPQLRLARNRAGQLAFAPKKGAAHAVSTRATAQKPINKSTETSPWMVELARFALHKGEVVWADDSTPTPVRLTLAQVELQAQALRWPFAATPATFEGAASLGRTGAPAGDPTARFAFKGEGTDQTGKVHATVGDVALGLAAPYAAQFVEPRVAGVLNAELDARWSPDGLQLLAQRVALSDFALKARAGKPVAANATSLSNAAERAAAELPQFKLLEVTDAQVDLTAKTARIGKVALRSPSMMLHRDAQGQWQPERWLKSASPAASATAPVTTTTAATPVKPWAVTVADVLLDDATVSLDDRSLSKPVRLQVAALKVQMQNLALDGKKLIPLTVSARIKSGRTESGKLAFKGSAMWAPVVAQGTLSAVDIPVHAVAPYLADKLNVELLRADTSFKGQLRYAATPAGPEVQVRGDVALAEFLANSASEELLRWKSLSVPGIVLAMAPGVATRLDVREATLTDFFARIVVNASGRINLQDLVKSEKPAAEPVAPLAAPAALPAPALDPVIQFGPVSLLNGRVLFTDNFIQPNYSADLSQLTGKLSQFSSKTSDGVMQLADLDVRGRAEGTAALEITGKVNPLAKPLALDIQGRVRDLELPPLSPYAIKYAGYGIQRGKLSVDVNYTVKPDGELTASNNIILNQLAFGDKVEGAPNSLPVKLAVALLADRNGVIDLNLPISGSLNDPQFKLGAVVWKVITNLIVKAITSPFSLLASAFGGAGGDELSAVHFAPGSAVLDASAMQGLDKIAKALTERSSLVMTVVGTASLELERDALKGHKLAEQLMAEKRRHAAVSGQSVTAVTPVERGESEALLKAVYKRADITKPRNMVGLTKDIPSAEMEALLKANIAVNEDSMRELALQRSVVVKDYLASRQLPTDRLFLGAAKTSASKTPEETPWKPRAELNLTTR